MARRGFPVAWVIAVASSTLIGGALGCATSSGGKGVPREPSTAMAPSRILVRSILTDASLSTLASVRSMTFDEVVERAAQHSTLLSSPHVLVVDGEQAVLQLPADESLQSDWNLTRYAVAAASSATGQAGVAVRISLDLTFASGWAAATTIVVRPEQLVFAQLENGLVLVTQAVSIGSEPDLVRAAEAGHERSPTLN